MAPFFGTAPQALRFHPDLTELDALPTAKALSGPDGRIFKRTRLESRA